MTFTKTTEYALRTLTFMAQKPDALYSATFLHKQLKIPHNYLQRLLTDLTKCELLKSVRGRHGGFTFFKKIDKIRLSEIINAVEGFKDTPSCFFGFSECAVDNPCAMHEVWTKWQTEIIKKLSTTSLVDLIPKK